MGCLLRSRQAEGLSVAVGSCLERLREIKLLCMRMCLQNIVCELPFLQQWGGWIEGAQQKVCSSSRKGLVVSGS